MSVKYSNYLEISPTFESVVDIDADTRNANLWREYIVGEDMEKLLEVLCQSLGNESPDARRSFWVEGSYGTGKSYAAIFTKHLMEEKPEVVEDFLSKNSRLAKYKNRFCKYRKSGDYLVVWKTGCTGIRSGDMLLIEAENAIQNALKEKFGDKAYLGAESLRDVVLKKLNDPTINWDNLLQLTILSDNYSSADELRDLVKAGDLQAVQEAAAVLHDRHMGLVNNLETFQKWVADVIAGNHLEKSGIFFIWDEFTEYVKNSDDHTILQQLSEFSKEQPFFMLFVVHRSNELVEKVGGSGQYQLISHRFHTVEFHLTADASLDLIAGSINVLNGMDVHWAEAKKAVLKTIRPYLTDFGSGLDDRLGDADMVEKLCPMHPMTVRLLSSVADNYAAAERTMFRFMKDRANENAGFVGYIHQYGPDDQACWLTPDWLWDYFFTRESDFHDKASKVPEYIRHYEDSLHLIESSKDAVCVFKTAMLLMAVMSTAKGIYGGRTANGGISATVGCLRLCLAGVMSANQVNDLLATLQENKLIVLDPASNGTVRLQLPFRGTNDDFKARYDINDAKYTRYRMFAKDGEFAKAVETKVTKDNANDAYFKRIKVCACCAETNSIKNRLEDITSELKKCPYKIGLLLVVCRDENNYLGIQNDLQQRSTDMNEPRLVIALLKEPLKDEARQKWLTAITRQEMANESGQTGAAGQYATDASMVIATWVASAVAQQMTAWNLLTKFSNQYGIAQLSKTIQHNVILNQFPYAPETIVIAETAYKICNTNAPLAGIQRTTNNSQLRSVLNGMGQELLELKTIDQMASAQGGKAAASISNLAKTLQDKMQSGQRVVLSEFWDRLQQPPFGYYDCIACGVLLGYVFSCYKNSAFSWTDSQQSPHVLAEATLNTMVGTMVKGKLTTDYLSSGSQTFQKFRDYVKALMNLADVDVANETECWHNMRGAITKAGAPYWTLKYLPEGTYQSEDHLQASSKIIDQMQLFIVKDTDREEIMSEIIQQFTGRGKVRQILAKSFSDRSVLQSSFRSFLFDASPELMTIANKLDLHPEQLNDKLHQVMQDAIYTWTEDQVKAKLADVVQEYQFLDAMNSALGKVYHSVEEAKTALSNLFKFVHIPLSVVEKMGMPWYGALSVMYETARGEASHFSPQKRTDSKTQLDRYGKQAMDFLKDGKLFLANYLDSLSLSYSEQELKTVYSGLSDIGIDSSTSQFESEMKRQVSKISHARNKQLLLSAWQSLTGKDTVKDWCTEHNAPLFWIIPREMRKVFLTVISVQNGENVTSQDVTNALNAFKSADMSILTDDNKVRASLLKTVGSEYKDVFETEGQSILMKAKLSMGNDMSIWDVGEIHTFQAMLKEAQKEKAKREKLTAAKTKVRGMDVAALRSKVEAFLDAHPEFSDSFIS